MNWYKIAQVKATKNIVFDIYSAITNVLGGSWTVLEDKNMMKAFNLQSYRIIHIDGKDVIMPGDYFWVEVKILVLKALNVLHPWAGTYEGAQNWQQGKKSDLRELAKKQKRWPMEEEQKRWEALHKLQPEDASTYNEQYGNRLITFDVLVYGKKPDGKAAPTHVNKIQVFFGQGDLEKIASAHNEFDTPIEIAQYVQNVIRNYYGGDDRNEDYLPQPDDTPSEFAQYTPSPQMVSV
jgi:hypothetical protein